MKRIFILLFTGILIFTGLINLQASALIEHSKQYAEMGYLELDEIYSMYGNEFKYNYSSISSMINENNEMFDEYTLVVVQQSTNNKWIYTRNSSWNIPLISGRIFDEVENESSKQFCISNKVCSNQIGKPLLTDQSNYYNLKSLIVSEDSFDMYLFYSDVPLNGFAKLTYNPSYYERPNMQLYTSIYFLTCFFLIIFMFMIYFQQSVNLIAVRKFLGHSMISLFFEFSSNIILIILSSFTVSIVIFFLMNPMMTEIALFRYQIVQRMINIGILVIVFIIFTNLYIFYKLKTTKTIQVLRGVD